MATTTFRSPYRAFPIMEAVHTDPHRFRVLCCGRQSGKTTFAMAEVVRALQAARYASGTPARALVVSPTYKLLHENWRTLMQYFGPAVSAPNLSEMRCFLPDGEVEFRSADSEAGVGRGGHYAVALFDEAARVPETVWQEEVRPALAVTNGKAIFISTPWGRNWFYRLFLMAQEHPDYASWSYTTLECWRSRHLGHDAAMRDAEREWQSIQRTTPQRVFEQEYLAKFLEHEGSLWTLERSLRGSLRPALPGRHYIAGLDVAHIEDWMAVVVLEVESRQVVSVSRFRHHDWALQKASTLFALRPYPDCRVLVDSTGLGDPIAYDLRQAGLDVEDMVFTQRHKQEMVENLTVALEQGYLGIPDQAETVWLLEELRSYRELQNEHGPSRYGAPPGLHDDGVTALMLAAWGMRFELSSPMLEEPKNLDGFSLREALDYGKRLDRFRELYPEVLVPEHPRDLSWRFHRDRL